MSNFKDLALPSYLKQGDSRPVHITSSGNENYWLTQAKAVPHTAQWLVKNSMYLPDFLDTQSRNNTSNIEISPSPASGFDISSDIPIPVSMLPLAPDPHFDTPHVFSAPRTVRQSTLVTQRRVCKQRCQKALAGGDHKKNYCDDGAPRVMGNAPLCGILKYPQPLGIFDKGHLNRAKAIALIQHLDLKQQHDRSYDSAELNFLAWVAFYRVGNTGEIRWEEFETWTQTGGSSEQAKTAKRAHGWESSKTAKGNARARAASVVSSRSSAC